MDYDDLLLGIGSDDLDDFDVEGDYQAQEDATGSHGHSNTDSGRVSPCSPVDLDQDSEDWDAPEVYPLKRRKISEDAFVIPQTSGFSTGSGRPVPPPSREALKKAMAIIGDIDRDEDDASETTPVPRPGGVFILPAAALDQNYSHIGTPLESYRSSLFTTGNGSAIAGPSKVALSAVADLFGDLPESQCARAEDVWSEASSAIPQAMGFTTGGGKAVAKPSRESLLRASALFANDTPSQATLEHEQLAMPASASFVAPSKIDFTTATVTAAPAPARPFELSQMTTPFRTPLRTTTNVFASRPENQTPVRQSKVASIHIKTPAPIQIKTPASAIRRVGMGLTPLSRNKARKSFITPFKDPAGSSRLASLGRPTTPRTSLLPENRAAQTQKALPIVPVFDLHPPSGRENWLAAWLHPGYYDVAELHEMGLPDELWNIDLDNAPYYQFIAEDASPLGTAEALAILQREKCYLATQKWVTNHYSQILWKLAGQIRAKPSLWNDKWNWAEVISQLLYRYEREIGNAQRPIIRRIQEHDSSPSLPLVLCVTAIRKSPPNIDSKGIAVPVKPYLELSDGWYRIVAEIDDCMSRAIERGKIVVGRKLSISGAKLESGSDGAEVLDAFDKSRIIISGNSCSLARWHVRLGQQAQPFVAGLSSLSVDGGAVMLVDIIIDKLYPIAFMPVDKAIRDPPWNEQEEQIRADQWRDKYTAESARLHDEMRRQLDKIEDLVEQICGMAQDSRGSMNSTPPETLENDFESLLAAPNASARLRSFSDSHIAHLASYSQMRMQRELTDGHAEVEAELQCICPERDVRDFRMARVVDAQNLRKDKMRVGMLNIWDARALGEGALQEGRRYLVSNLMPGRSGDWRVPTAGETTEITLHTRRDTRWKMIDM